MGERLAQIDADICRHLRPYRGLSSSGGFMQSSSKGGPSRLTNKSLGQASGLSLNRVVFGMVNNREAWAPIVPRAYQWEYAWNILKKGSDHRLRGKSARSLATYTEYISKIEWENCARLANLVSVGMAAINKGIEHRNASLADAGMELLKRVHEDWGTRYHYKSNSGKELEEWARKVTLRHDLLPPRVRRICHALRVKGGDA